MLISRNPLGLLLRNLKQRAILDEEDQQAVLGLPVVVKTLSANGYVIREGDDVDCCEVLVSGFAFRQLLTGDGKRQILAIHIPGDALDFQNLFLDVADHSVQMLTAGEVAFVPRAAVQKLFHERSRFAQAVFINVLVDAAIFRESVLNLGQRDARSRMAHIICEFMLRCEMMRFNGPDNRNLPMTQEQLADATGLSAVHANRVLRDLAAENLIQPHRGHISIPDWRKLRAIADFNDRYLHLSQQIMSNDL